MAPLLFKEMKGVNFPCASPASAAVCTSIDRRSMVRPCSGRALDRHSPHIRDSRRAKPITNPISQAPSKPKSYTQKSRKRSDKQVELISPADSSRCLLNDTPYFDVLSDLEEPLPPLLPPEPARPHTSKGDDPRLQPFSRRDDSAVLRPSSFKAFDSAFVRPSSFKGDDSAVLKPPSSFRGDGSDVSRSSTFEGDDDSAVLKPSSPRPKDQVVVLRVSLHCKGCEGKVRKHISKMAGVTSFNIDFATKKVTVIGDVTPLGVLNSISKVKNAQFWPSPPTSSKSP
ncbi:protein SODIUM POTASSIUM ROOT DEFECTIVE 1 [Elaeis guineensis]|uniref:Protein SODIUM POTASSIUM ROOT DEFECTIVE 1 n=1 Tax=Elaeis guineensis var. tenera TaxID=51953 RepID=A0A6I9R874_ELAGV|nr:protein SODIUM POTASSIUM ROOT DEFECTIVE 1 [Elaeis guineensis]